MLGVWDGNNHFGPCRKYYFCINSFTHLNKLVILKSYTLINIHGLKILKILKSNSPLTPLLLKLDRVAQLITDSPTTSANTL